MEQLILIALFSFFINLFIIIKLKILFLKDYKNYYEYKSGEF